MTEEEIQTTLDEAHLSGSERAMAERLLHSERLHGQAGDVSHSALNKAVGKLRDKGVLIAREPAWTDEQLTVRASGGQAGRPVVMYRLLEPGEKAPLAPKPQARISRPGARKKAEVVPAAPKPAAKPSVYPKGMKHLPLLPDFGGELMTTGLVLTDSGAVEVHLRNGEGTFIAELTGYRAKEHAQ